MNVRKIRTGTYQVYPWIGHRRREDLRYEGEGLWGSLFFGPHGLGLHILQSSTMVKPSSLKLKRLALVLLSIILWHSRIMQRLLRSSLTGNALREIIGQDIPISM